MITVNEEVIPEPEPEPVYVAPTSSAPATTTVAPSGGGYDASTYTPGWCMARCHETLCPSWMGRCC